MPGVAATMRLEIWSESCALVLLAAYLCGRRTSPTTTSCAPQPAATFGQVLLRAWDDAHPALQTFGDGDAQARGPHGYTPERALSVSLHPAHNVVRTHRPLLSGPAVPLSPPPVVLVAAELSPAAVAELGDSVDVRRFEGADRAALLEALPEADAVLVRSATRIDAEALGVAPRLRVIARAGVGLDNVDVRAATQAGVMVVNAPAANVVSAAELTVGLLLAVARRLPAAQASLQRGEWSRSDFIGTELHDKTVGVLGLGRVGVLVAQRLAAFGMHVIAHDPYVQAGRAAQMGVRMTGLADLMRQADVVTVHLPRTAETLGLIGVEQLALAKPGLILINAARGGIVDEAALYDALKSGRIAGAGLDVWAQEPATDSPLLDLDNVVATPHLGASTHEAQERVGVTAARSVMLGLRGELVPDAVNVQGGSIAEDVRPGIPLVEKLGRIFTALAGEVAQSLDVEVRGEIVDHDVKVLELAALTGVFADVVGEQVSYVNAPLLAAERGLEVRLVTDPESPDHRNLITLRGTLADGTQVSVSGTLVGIAQRERLVELDGFSIDLEPTEHLLFYRYEDRPGVVGVVGRILGDARVNIAGMQVSRDRRGGHALVALSVDSPVLVTTVEEIRQAIRADAVHAIDL